MRAAARPRPRAPLTPSPPAGTSQNGDGKISYDEFISFKSQENADAETSGELLEAFRMLAGDKEYVMVNDLERELAPELFEYCKANMIPFEGGPEGALDYASFAAALYGESDL